MRVIDKYFNKYFARLLIKQVKFDVKYTYNLDVRTIHKHNEYWVEIKPHHFNDDQYVSIFYCNEQNATLYFSNYRLLYDVVKTAINNIIPEFKK